MTLMTLVLVVTRWLLYFLVSHPCSRQEEGGRAKCSSSLFFFLKSGKQAFLEVSFGWLWLQQHLLCWGNRTMQLSWVHCVYMCNGTGGGNQKEERIHWLPWREIAKLICPTWKCDRNRSTHTETKLGFFTLASNYPASTRNSMVSRTLAICH